MKGVEAVSVGLDKLRFRVSRLIELNRVPPDKGRNLLWKLIELRDLARGLENGN